MGGTSVARRAPKVWNGAGRMAACVLCVGSVLSLTGSLRAEDFDVTAFGAVADGKTDCAAAIGKTLAAVGKAGGGRVVIPAAANPYIVTKTVRIGCSNVEVIGQGATLRLGDYVLTSNRDHVLHISGSRSAPVKNVTVRGLTIDANYWNQKNTVEVTRKGKTRQASLKPRGVLVEYAQDILLDHVQVRRAWVSLAFGRGAAKCEARDCTVSEWHNDAFDAAGTARNIHFLRCKAHNAHNTAEFTGFRDASWEIEDGIQQIKLTDCVVENTSATGFKLRSHNSASVNRGIQFIRCKALVYSGFSIQGRDHDTRTEDVLLRDCHTPGVLSVSGGADDVRIEGGTFGVVSLAPRRLQIRNASASAITINATEKSDGKGKYVPQITIENVKLGQAPRIVGNEAAVRIVGQVPKAVGPKAHFILEDFSDEALCRQRIESMVNVTLYKRKGVLRGFMLSGGKPEGSVVWKVQRPSPIERCMLGMYGYIPVNGKRGFLFSVSADKGKTWQEVARDVPATANCRYPRHIYDITAAVKGRKGFLLKVTFLGGGRLFRLMVTTVPQ